jgi:hypothetical protein
MWFAETQDALVLLLMLIVVALTFGRLLVGD